MKSLFSLAGVTILIDAIVHTYGYFVLDNPNPAGMLAGAIVYSISAVLVLFGYRIAAWVASVLLTLGLVGSIVQYSETGYPSSLMNVIIILNLLAVLALLAALLVKRAKSSGRKRTIRRLKKEL